MEQPKLALRLAPLELGSLITAVVNNFNDKAPKKY